MGRRHHLEQTVGRVLGEFPGSYCLVDYSCPEGSGEWLTTAQPDAIATGRVRVVYERGHTKFHKTKALNVGARFVADRGAEWLCFLDADTLVHPGLAEWLEARAGANRFFFAGLTERRHDVPSLMGVLVVRAAEFLRVGGFDERYRGWGAEDIDMRARLKLLAGLEHEHIPLRYLGALEHPDQLRTRFYDMPDIRRSHAANDHIFRDNIRVWTGLELEQLQGSVREVFPARWLEGRLKAERPRLPARARGAWKAR